MNRGICEPLPPVSAHSDEGTSKHHVNFIGGTAQCDRQRPTAGLYAWNTHKLITPYGFTACSMKICPIIDKQASLAQRQET